MIFLLLSKIDLFIVKWYGNLHLYQLRIIKLYNEGGITENIANKELYNIYNFMRFSKFIDKIIMNLLAKIQSISLQR